MITHFNELSLPQPLAQALTQMQFVKPTPIQAQAIPLGLDNKDIIGSAQTGTGKTAAFCIPLIAKLHKEPQMTALILTPTRELAMQVTTVFKQMTRNMPQLNPVLLIGGADIRVQMKYLRNKPRVLIATPGRLIDLLHRRMVNIQKVGFLVIDEADRMLDMGFTPQLEDILKYLPPQRQTMLFSATFPKDIERLAAKFLHNPTRIAVGPVSKPIETIKQSLVRTSRDKKNETLLDEINQRQGSILVFVKTQVRTDQLMDYLSDFGLSVTLLHGGRTQSQRSRAIEGFRNGRYRVLVATDIAARGLDIPHIAHVINYDLPQDTDDYLHRIGRTARAGAEGESISLLLPEDSYLWNRIAKLYNPANYIEKKKNGGKKNNNKPFGKKNFFKKPKRGPGPREFSRYQ